MTSLAQRLQAVPLRPQYNAEEAFHVPLGDWAPDNPLMNAATDLEALNVFPRENGEYGPWQSQEVESDNATDDYARGAAIFIADDNQPDLIIGDNAKLYRYRKPTIEDVSKAGGYSTGSEGLWRFARYGAQCIATNYNDEVQERLIGAPVATKFADLITSTNKPKARYCATVNQFLVLGDTNDATDGQRPGRVWWSAFNNPADFDPSAATQSDFEDLASGGQVTGVVGGAEYGVVFQTSEIRRMAYVGPPQIFRIEPVDRIRGCRYPTSIIAHGRMIFYYSDEGFMVFDGTSSRPIGSGKVDQTFKRALTPSDGPNLTATKYPDLNLVMWAIPQGGGAATLMFIYNWGTGRWAQVQVNLQQLAIGIGASALVDDQTSNVDTGELANALVDSAQFRGGGLLQGGVDNTGKVAWFTGPNLAATVTSAERMLFPNQRAQVTATIPYANGAVSMRVNYRDTQSDGIGASAFSQSVSVMRDQYDRCQFRGKVPTARYHTFTMTTAAGAFWDNIQSAQVYAAPTGDK